MRRSLHLRDVPSSEPHPFHVAPGDLDLAELVRRDQQQLRDALAELEGEAIAGREGWVHPSITAASATAWCARGRRAGKILRREQMDRGVALGCAVRLDNATASIIL